MLTALAASATDIPAKVAKPSAPAISAAGVLTATDWTGFYLGGHIGHGWVESRGTYDDFGDAGPIDFIAKGFVGGAQAGYLWQIGRLVYGVETDGTWGSLDASRADHHSAVQRMETKFLGSGRFITGAAIDNILVYGSIGLGYAQSKFSVTGDAPGPASQKVDGWGIASSFGVEMAIAPNWSLRGEYLYYGINKSADIPGLTTVSSSTDFVKVDGIHVARLAANYRFNGLQTRAAAPAANWAGFYVGAHGGYGTSSRIAGVFNESNDNGALDFDPRGFVGGLQAGYNIQSGAFVYGVEADGSWSGMKDDRTEGDGDTQSLTTRALASLRGRVGIAADKRLYYLTGGWGFARSKLDVVQSGRPANVSFDSNGVVIGSGFDWAWGPNWSVRLEGLTYLFGKRIGIPALTGASDPQDYARQSTVNVVRIGANYSFGGPY
jgi:outer membrane immunogenic protein